MLNSNHTVEQEEVMAYLDGELPTERAAAAAAHLERCQECQKLAADLQTISQRLLAWQIESSDPRVTQSVAAALQEGGRPQEDAVGLSWRKWRDILGVRRVSPWVWGLGGAFVVVLLVLSLPWHAARLQ